MNALIACFLCLLINQATSEDNPTLANSVLLYSNDATCSVQGNGVIGCSPDCKSRRYCMDSVEVAISCYAQTGKTYCDPNTLLCTTTPTVCDNNNTTGPPDTLFKCPRDGLFPYALNCTRFWSCNGANLDLLQCKNLIYDPVNKKCATGIPCYTFSPVTGLCKGKNETIVVHPLNRAIYALCSGAFPTVRECPSNHVFNTNILDCDFVCNKIGNFPDPADTKCFYSCTKPQLTLISEHECCNDGFKFNETLAVCARN